MMTGAQIRAARALLDWNQGELAKAAGLSDQTIKRMEANGPGRSAAENVAAVQRALEANGVRFIAEGPYHGDGGPGVRLLG